MLSSPRWAYRLAFVSCCSLLETCECDWVQSHRCIKHEPTLSAHTQTCPKTSGQGQSGRTIPRPTFADALTSTSRPARRLPLEAIRAPVWALTQLDATPHHPRYRIPSPLPVLHPHPLVSDAVMCCDFYQLPIHGVISLLWHRRWLPLPVSTNPTLTISVPHEPLAVASPWRNRRAIQRASHHVWLCD